jgi:isocitrate dehydrogenase (NAD+)
MRCSASVNAAVVSARPEPLGADLCVNAGVTGGSAGSAAVLSMDASNSAAPAAGITRGHGRSPRYGLRGATSLAPGSLRNRALAGPAVREDTGFRPSVYVYPPPPMRHRVTLIPGDGTGPELTEATRRVLEATGVGFDWDVQQAGVDVMETAGTPLPEETLDSVKRNKVALKGPITTPIGTGFRSVNVALRHELGLYACLRPCKTYEGVRSRYDKVDLVLVRENTEDLYAGIEYEAGTSEAEHVIAELNKLQKKQIASGSGISVKPISRAGSERIVRFAFEYARAHGRKRVSCVTKANIMKFTDGLFLEVFREVAKEYPEIEPWENLVDAVCMGLVQRPEEFDVLVLPNLYGDIVSDLTAGLVGGLGVAPGGNIGPDSAVFEATHGSAPKYKGQNRVNPTAMILSGKLMLDHLGEADAAERLERAVADVIREGTSVTYDMKPSRDDPTAVGTSEYADAIIDKLEA